MPTIFALHCHTHLMGALITPANDLLTAAEAAVVADVRPATIRQWVSRGHLRRSATRGRVALFDRGDVARAAELTFRRSNARPVRAVAHVPERYYNRELTTGEVAKLFDVTPSTVRSWVRRGHLVPTGNGSGSATSLWRCGLDAAEAPTCRGPSPRPLRH